ncbi:helix-turn-helix domain-containing protein [Brevibacillus ruminantium]|uniref:Helix-turn-helix domain-containing protein n=1 Tax=Brevibacillus ruminantium TaxID=2950604 RepID=A0ABY4W9T1_9BACL|nr:helix-turn-helix domain-containing protein [Brevibacillus ruminantium]USG63813.1 helix-turn-helix domain-containing protein [Brevibacillus ruminantium]
MYEWKKAAEKVRQATGLPISYFYGKEHEVAQKMRQWKKDGWEIVAYSFSPEESSLVAIPSDAWEGVSRTLLSLLFSEPPEREKDTGGSLHAQLTSWLTAIVAGGPALPPEGLVQQWHWQEPRLPFLLEHARDEGSHLWTALTPMLDDFFKGAPPSAFLLSSSYFLLAVPVSSLGKSLDLETRMEWASSLHDLITTECMENVRVIAGEPIDQPSLLDDALSKALTLSRTLRKFRSKTMVACTSHFPLERWALLLPSETQASLLRTVEEMMPLPQLSSEQIETLEAFFALQLNISETARQLFLHRNTLIYRLDKLTEQTGLDPRQFTEAVLLQLLLLFRQK